jgi:hypothetical protein
MRFNHFVIHQIHHWPSGYSKTSWMGCFTRWFCERSGVLILPYWFLFSLIIFFVVI